MGRRAAPGQPAAATRPTIRSPTSIPMGRQASNKPAEPAGKPRIPAYGTTRLSAPTARPGGSHCACSRVRAAWSVANRRLTLQLRRSTERPSPNSWPGRSGSPARVTTAAQRWHPAVSSSACRAPRALWETSRRPAPGALDALLSGSRARLLTALDDPARTTQLARVLPLAVGAVGDHLAVLHHAGLLSRSRAGRSVLYRRTPLGDALAGGSPG